LRLPKTRWRTRSPLTKSMGSTDRGEQTGTTRISRAIGSRT
jgi:hypothetical protein